LGLSIYYAQGFETISDDLKDVKPHVFSTVPRLLERVYDKIISKGKLLDGVKKKLFFWAVELGHEFEFEGKNMIYKAKLATANQLIFSQWRKALGGNIKFVISGGAALQSRLARIFWAAGIPIREGYGLTETAPVITLNRQTVPGIKFGTVGPTIGKEQEIKIAEDGEILFRGPNLMLGYFKNQELTDEVIDKEGWFHTGDVGIIEDGMYLKITDRKKEMFKLSTGKYVAPQVIENILKQSFFIEQAMVVGENEKFPGALISPNFEFLHNWATENKIIFRTNEELVKNHTVIDTIKKEIIILNQKLGQTEHVKVFKIVCEEWTPGSGELSPTLKLKRHFVMNKYKHLVENMFAKK
jgi:long-chain acyl-CoA synthetase